jgi:hypothetical protein
MPDYTVHPEVQAFLQEQESYRATLMEQLKSSEEYRDHISDEQLWTNFKLMEVYDQMGQFVCNRYPFNSTERKNGPTNQLSNTPVPVAPGSKDVILTFDVQDESNAMVKPYPFDVSPLVVSFPGRLIPNRSYANQQDFLPQFYTAERVTMTYRLHAA